MLDEEPSPPQLNTLERDLVRSFGWNLIASETTLYERYLRISVKRSLSTMNEFRAQLREMEAKGLLTSYDVQGLKFYRLTTAVDGLRDMALPETPLDEMHLAVGTLKAEPKTKMFRKEPPPSQPPAERSVEVPRVNRMNVAKCEYICKRLQRALEVYMLRESGRVSKAKMNEHMANMWHALCESEEALLDYVESEVPGLHRDVAAILGTDGPELLMLSLRLADVTTKKYR
ncbi:MAG: hypothetical protein ACP6KW_02940 [Candidatus Thorarchaeota archaeon]